VRRLLPLAAVLLAACSGAQLSAQKAQIADLQSKNDALTSSLSERVAERDAAKVSLSAAQARAADAEAKEADAEGKLGIAQGRVDTLTKSNKDLSDAAGASATDLGGKLNAAIAEKDDLAKRLAESQQKELAATRLKGIYKSARDKAAADLALSEQQRADLETRVERFEVARDSEAARQAAYKTELREELGTVADAILPDIQAGRAFASASDKAILIKLSDSLLFDGDTAKLTDGGAAALEKVGRALKALGPRVIRVEAHNDASPMKRGLLGGYADHWELSAAQAAAAARALSERAGLEAARMSAVGDAQYHPFPTGDDGCADNRCVQISAEQVLTE